MNPTALARILLSAGFHAIWNALVKRSRDKQACMWLIHITDKVGVAHVAPLRFQYLMALSRFILYCGAIFPWKGWQLLDEAKLHWKSAIAVSLLQFLAYQLVLTAMTMAQVSYVAAVRQMSVLLAVFTGSVMLRQGHLTLRMTAAASITLGVVLIGWKG